MGRGALVAAALGVMMLPSAALAAREPTCANAYASGNYIVIIGSGTIQGTSGDDLSLGSAGADTIFGGRGNDVICGRGGPDVLDGGNGDDLVLNGVDTLWGDESNDSLASGNGDDRLFGGNPGGDGYETDSCDGAADSTRPPAATPPPTFPRGQQANLQAGGRALDRPRLWCQWSGFAVAQMRPSHVSHRKRRFMCDSRTSATSPLENTSN